MYYGGNSSGGAPGVGANDRRNDNVYIDVPDNEFPDDEFPDDEHNNNQRCTHF